MTWKELQEAVIRKDGPGYTALSNPLEDFLFARLPNDYYRVWRYVWRKTFGFRKTADFLLLRDFVDNCIVPNTTIASRALFFFELCGLITYVRGTRKQQGQRGTASHITILPNGLPDDDAMRQLGEYIAAAMLVELDEKKQRKPGQYFAYVNAEFGERVKKIALQSRCGRDASAMPSHAGRISEPAAGSDAFISEPAAGSEEGHI